MTNRIVLAYAGDLESTVAIPRLARDHQADVIAVAVDLGNGPPLAELRDAALTAGAVRCHALDVREEFARECIVPALRAGIFDDPDAVVAALARDFVARKVEDVARLERATAVPIDAATAAAAARPLEGTASARRAARAAGPAYVEIHFQDGAPVSVNGVPMTIVELMESVETITGRAAIDVLDLAYQDLGRALEGRVALRVKDGECTLVSPAVVL